MPSNLYLARLTNGYLLLEDVMKYQRGFTLFELIFVAFWAAGIGGWIANIYKLCNASFDPLTGLVVGRVVGVFVPPIGAVLGFF